MPPAAMGPGTIAMLLKLSASAPDQLLQRRVPLLRTGVAGTAGAGVPSTAAVAVSMGSSVLLLLIGLSADICCDDADAAAGWCENGRCCCNELADERVVFANDSSDA